MKRPNLFLCAALLAASLALLCGCAATGVTQEQVSASPSGPLPLSKAEKTYIGMIEDNYDQIVEVNANIMAVALKTRPLPSAAIKAINKTLKAKSKLVLFWNDFKYPTERLAPISKAWTKVRNDDITFTGRLVDFINHSSSEKKMKAAIHALAIMGRDWGRWQASIKKLKAEAAGHTQAASPSP